MRALIFAHDANLAVDRPLCSVSRARLTLLLPQLREIGKRRYQYLCPARDPKKQAASDYRTIYADVSGIDSRTQWRIVHQTVPDEGPGFPCYQMVPI